MSGRHSNKGYFPSTNSSGSINVGRVKQLLPSESLTKTFALSDHLIHQVGGTLVWVAPLEVGMHHLGPLG